ncbi:MAG: EamA family transporter RarD [Gammaproteobacteria bacterium]|jgi:chloramphenicol-sensitive protein RarD
MIESSEERSGVIFAIAAYTFWGFGPVYFKLVDAVPATEVLGHRIVWSVVFLVGILAFRRQLGTLADTLKDRRILGLLMISAVLIAINWVTYIWAVQSGHILQASLGYYINPLVSVSLGIVVLRERLRLLQIVAVVLAATGTTYLAVVHGSLPWASLILAFSFGCYGLVRKTLAVGALQGLAVETLLLMPLALGYLGLLAMQGQGHFAAGDGLLSGLLVAAGMVTILPLVWFANAARRLPLSMVGFFQYIAPTVNFILAISVYGEAFGADQTVTFVLIWAALGLYTWDAVRVRRHSRVWRDLRVGPAPE